MKANPPSKVDVKARAAHELRELIILTAYLYAAFGAILFCKYAVLRGVGGLARYLGVCRSPGLCWSQNLSSWHERLGSGNDIKPSR